MPLDRLARFSASLATRAIPEPVRHAARRCLLDWLGATLPGGSQMPASGLAAALEPAAAGGALLYPSLARVAGRDAALINATAAHTVEVDDIFRDALYHPGAPVIGAALALAQAGRHDGESLLRAMVAGYEISTRIGAALAPAHYRHWHSTGTIGTLGAAAAGASLLGLDAERSGHALANAATLAAGLQQALLGPGMGKPLHAGHAAGTGVLVALGAAHGITGARRMLDGAHGLAQAMAAGADWEVALAGLGERWNCTAITHKVHACCGHCFAALDAVLALRAGHGLAPGEVSAVRVMTYAKAVEITAGDAPSSPAEARFSLPYCAGAALVLGRVGLDAFTPRRLADPAIRSLAARVRLEVDPQAEAAYPGRRSARVEVHTRDGRLLAHHAPTRRGDPEDPLDDAALEAKFRSLADPVIGAAAAARLAARAWRLEHLASATELAW